MVMEEKLGRKVGLLKQWRASGTLRVRPRNKKGLSVCSDLHDSSNDVKPGKNGGVRLPLTGSSHLLLRLLHGVMAFW